MYAIKTQRCVLFFVFFLAILIPPHGNKFQMIKKHHQMKKITPLSSTNVHVLAIYTASWQDLEIKV